MNAIQLTILLATFINALSLFTGLKKIKPVLNTKKNLQIKESDYTQVSWDDGEVAWDFEMPNLSENNSQIVLVQTPEKIVEDERDKIWSLVEELRMQGAISGFLNVAYYNTAVSDNIVNDIQNYHIKSNMNLANIIIYNFNNEIDIILTLLTIYGYRKYKESRIVEFIHYWEEKYKNNYYLEEYRNIRKISASFALMGLIIFCKSVKSAS